MNDRTCFRFILLMFTRVIYFFFILNAMEVNANDIIKYRASITQPDRDEVNYNPVEAYGGEIRYTIPPNGAIIHAEIYGVTSRIDYSAEIEAAVDFWRNVSRDLYPQLNIRRANNPQEVNFRIGYSSALNMLAGRPGLEPAIAYIPQTGDINTLVLRHANLAGQYGIYVDNFLAGMNDEIITAIMRTFSDIHNPGEAIKRYMYILLVRHFGYALGFVPDNPEVYLFGNNIPWYSPEIYYILSNDGVTPRLMYRNNTFEYINDLIMINGEEDAFTINDIRLSPQEEFVIRMCSNTDS
ncbi:hypothetical protein [Xenorhabdus griffiniae]|uniref:Uncharacterized protein n=2 Tax=Xenorhabdus griffiniae TaxID=351672 RepID=A0ABY9XCL1_9GAMM|nr:hypothetical protein [Xenorhabdus griffiniae]MBD1226420.1 hypothetical protein [Xenorhabdus griffiniae]WMV70646.1 hypothetical protein QL128_10385 [Xenorhabdus griffiniae]WNH00323.1 hypothetical protein QL112_010390 [Xenorhabdus griffiniae]